MARIIVWRVVRDQIQSRFLAGAPIARVNGWGEKKIIFENKMDD
jgi:hypothetical protein